MRQADAGVLGAGLRGSFLMLLNIFAGLGTTIGGGAASTYAGGAGSSGAGMAAAGEMGSSIFSTLASGVEGLLNRKAAKKEAKKAREFAERMRATAYQTMVKDLELAGLNPVLAAGGPATSTPTGPVAQTDFRTDFSGLRNAASRWFSGARQAKLFDAEVRSAAANAKVAESNAYWQPRLANAEASLKRSEHDLNYERAKLAISEDLESQARTRLRGAEKEMLDTELVPARVRAQFDATEFGVLLEQVRRTLGAVPSLGGGYSSSAGRNVGGGSRGAWSTQGSHRSRNVNVRIK